MTFINYLREISPNYKFLYFNILIISIYIFTQIVKINNGHILALIIAVIFIFYINEENKESVDNFNINMDYKLNSLLENIPSTNNYINYTEFFYIDTDLINLFYNIKDDFKTYNIDSYLNAIICTNNLLHIRHDIVEKSLRLCSYPPEKNANINPLLEINTSKKEKSICEKQITIENCVEFFEIAEKQVEKALNYIHSFIYNLPSDRQIYKKHRFILSRAHILYKRNLDIIKHKCDMYNKDNINYKTKFITDYGLPKAINKFNDDLNTSTIIKNKFNFF